MARISDEELNKIKQTVPLVQLVEAKGYELKPHGNDYVMNCPFHDDKTASLVITPAKNLWHCMGACQQGGSVIDWVMKTEGLSFRYAVELLKSDYLLLADTAASDGKQPKVVKYGTTPRLDAPISADSDAQTALKDVLSFYHQTLKDSQEAQEYLMERGLNDPELISTFKLGYANRTLGYYLPQKNRQAGVELRGKLQEIGILRDSGHEHFNGSIVVPIFDEQGAVTEVYGRKVLGNRLRKGTAIHTYLPGAHRGIWNHQALSKSKEVILCESLIDAMTFWCAGFRNVTASFGTSGFTDEMLQAFIKHDIEKVLIAYDRDDAGNTAAEKLAEKLSEHDIAVYRILFPKGMDANEYAKQVTPADKSLGLVIRKAEWVCGVEKQREHAAVLATNARQVDVELGSTSGMKSRAWETSQVATEPEKNDSNFPLLAATAAGDVELSNNPEQKTEDSNGAPIMNRGKVKLSEHEIYLTCDSRTYRVRGLEKNLSYEQLKLNVLVREGGYFHVDTLDIYSAKHRQSFIKQASLELSLSEDVIKCDLGKVLLKLEQLQDEQIRNALIKREKQTPMTDSEVKEAIHFLKSPTLLDDILADFDQCGVVGESTNKLVGYLAACSRKLERPLAVMVQSSSAAGKSSLMNAILSFMPEEERIQYSAMTGQSLFYMGEQDLKHKILAIAEEEGAENTSYALKLLQSEGEVSIASTGKNATTGNLETQEYRVEGPVMLFSTTTAIDIDEELMNRCLVLSVDESRAQTQAIHAQQRRRRTLEGLKAAKRKDGIIKRHQDAQRLLKPIAVMNPFADNLTFLDDKTRTRRDHEKYLSLIDVIALLHQHQRVIKREQLDGETFEYIEVTLQDIEIANRLAHEVLGRSLDELPPQTRTLLKLIHQHIKQDCQAQHCKQADYRFSRKDVRQLSGWTDFQVKKHMHRLEEMEYVLIHRGKRGQSMEYELLYQGEGKDDKNFLMGLIDVQKLQYDANKAPLKSEKKPLSSPQSAPKSPKGSTDKNHQNTMYSVLNETELTIPQKCTSIEKQTSSHHSYIA
jgi:DNA primase catalytic core